MTNIYNKYDISQSLNGDKIVYLARIGKQKQLIGRADTKKKLIELMEAEAKRVDAEEAEKIKQLALEQESTPPSSSKKIGLWKAGGLLKNQKKSVASASKRKEKEMG